MTLNEFFKKHNVKVFMAIFTIGLFNNNGYVMVNAGAESLSRNFDKVDMMPAFMISLMSFGSLSRIVNARYFI